MKTKVTIIGKALPIWLMAMLLVASGAGAAVGTVLQGNVIGEMPVTVSQALLAGKPVAVAATVDASYVDNLPQSVEWADGNGGGSWVTTGPDRSMGAVRDDRTAVQFAAEINQGDVYAFEIPLKNASDEDLVGILTLDFPDCFTVEVMDAAGDQVGPVVRTGLNSWKFALDGDAEYGVDDSLIVVVAADDVCPPGFYSLTAALQQIAY